MRDLAQGMDGIDVRAGVIKVGSSQDRVTELEHRVIRAAAAAQQETGAPITTHTTAGTAAIQQVRALEAAPATLHPAGLPARLWAAGLTDAAALVVANPARFLAWRAR